MGGVEPGAFIVGRRLGKEGRNRCFINDTAVTLGAMGSAVGGLLSFAGQHEYRRLLDPRYQLAVLDKWAGPKRLAAGPRFRDALRTGTRRRADGWRRAAGTRSRACARSICCASRSRS